MFKAIGRFFRTMGYAVTGQMNKISEIWEEDPHVVSEKYNKIINEKKARYETVIRAISRLMTAVDKKKERMELYKSQIEEKEKLLQGIKIAGKNRVADLKQKGVSVEDIKSDEKISSFATKATDTNASIASLQSEISNLDQEINADSDELKQFEVDLKQMQGDFKGLIEEREKAVLKLTTSDARVKAAELKSGTIDQDKTEKILQGVRDTVKNVENKTKLKVNATKDLNKEEEDKFIAMAESTTTNNDFLNDIGLETASNVEAVEKKNRSTQDDKYEE